MAIPSGAGTEVLKRAFKHANSDNWETMITGVANHIYTILTITFANTADALEDCRIKIVPDAGGTDIYLAAFQSLPGYGVFNWNDKFKKTQAVTLRFIRFGSFSNWVQRQKPKNCQT